MQLEVHLESDGWPASASKGTCSLHCMAVTQVVRHLVQQWAFANRIGNSPGLMNHVAPASRISLSQATKQTMCTVSTGTLIQVGTPRVLHAQGMQLPVAGDARFT
jgi:hypothetical protein